MPRLIFTGRLTALARRIHWKGEPKMGALTYFALDLNASLVQLDQLFGQGQPQAGAGELARGGAVDLYEALKNTGLISLGDADACVAHRNTDLLAFLSRLEGDCPSRRGEFDGVGQQVADNGIQFRSEE